MKATELLNPGTYSGSQQLRARVAHAISFAETITRYRDPEADPAPTAVSLAAFFADAATKTPGYAGPVLPGTQAVVTSGQTIDVTGGTVTLTVTDGVVSAEYVAA